MAPRPWTVWTSTKGIRALARPIATSSDRPIKLHNDAESGHAGGQLFKKIVKDSTDELTFVAWQIGVK